MYSIASPRIGLYNSADQFMQQPPALHRVTGVSVSSSDAKLIKITLSLVIESLISL